MIFILARIVVPGVWPMDSERFPRPFPGPWDAKTRVSEIAVA